ncbi:MAK10-like protein, partial [Tanacetum coccineum]
VTKSYPVGIIRNVKVHIGRLKLLNDFYIIDLKKDLETPLLVGRGFLETANAVIDCRKDKIAVGEGITWSVFRVKETNPSEEEAPYWTTLGKRESYKPQPSSDGVGAQTPYYARKEFMDSHLLGESEVARDVEINPFNNDKPAKSGDGAWHAKIRIIDPDGEEFTKTFQTIPSSRKLSENKNPREIINLDHFHDT